MRFFSTTSQEALGFFRSNSPLNPLQWWVRWRYPVSLPEEVAKDLGLCVSNYLTFEQFVHCLLKKRVDA